MSSLLLKTRRGWIALGCISLATAVLILSSGAFEWPQLCCRHDDIDTNSGRVRHTRFLLYCQIDERTEETWLSQAFHGPSKSADWRRVTTLSPFARNSPHYQFHAAIHQIRTLQRCDEMVPFESDARRKAGFGLLSLWQSSGSYVDADRYVQEVQDVVSRLRRDGVTTVKASDLPDE